jgi:hypothetical protein
MFCREVTVEAPVAHLCILKPSANRRAIGSESQM